VTGGADAEQHSAIVEGELRDRSKDVIAYRLERDDLREDHRYDARTDDFGDPPFDGGEG
jgi:hypothetical protein